MRAICYSKKFYSNCSLLEKQTQKIDYTRKIYVKKTSKFCLQWYCKIQKKKIIINCNKILKKNLKWIARKNTQTRNHDFLNLQAIETNQWISNKFLFKVEFFFLKKYCILQSKGIFYDQKKRKFI